MAVKVRGGAGYSLGRLMKSARHPADRQAFWASHGFAQSDIRRLLDNACRLKVAAQSGKTGRPLLGKNLALLRSSEAEPESVALHQAGAELGAQVAHICLGERLQPGDMELREVSRMLGRLYDAIDCGAIGPLLAAQIARHSGVPVFRGLDRSDHPVGALADLMSIREHGADAAAPIAFFGDTLSLRGEAFVQAAEQLGFELRVAAGMPLAANDRAFLVDAADATHWRLHTPSGWIDDGERADNQRFVMQAVLIGAITEA